MTRVHLINLDLRNSQMVGSLVLAARQNSSGIRDEVVGATTVTDPLPYYGTSRCTGGTFRRTRILCVLRLLSRSCLGPLPAAHSSGPT
jgi:hypothetical protein